MFVPDGRTLFLRRGEGVSLNIIIMWGAGGGGKINFCLMRGGVWLSFGAYFTHFPTPPPGNYCTVPNATIYIISLSPGPGSAFGEKKKQNIGEWSEPAGSMGRKSVALSPFPDNRSAHFARRYSYFSYFTPFFFGLFPLLRSLINHVSFKLLS